MRSEAPTGSALTDSNREALAYVRACATRHRARHLAEISRVLASARVESDVGAIIVAVRRAAAVTVNFHPDRLLADGRSVAEALYDEGVYRSQFESKISNGGLTAYPGGNRDRREESLFGGAYQAPGVKEDERPKYGGLNLMNHSDGACPRFGSCHFRLTRAALGRSTFVFGDSAADPTDIAVIDAFEPVLAPLLERIALTGNALGREGLDVSSFLGGLLSTAASRGRGLFRRAPGRALDDYIETQIHGAVSLSADVEALVADPSFRGTRTGELLLATAELHGFPTEWHSGSALRVSEVPDDAPDNEAAAMPRWQAFCAHGRAARLARRVAEEYAVDRQHLDAAAIGQAAGSAVRHPEQWQEWGSSTEALRCLKDLWLILVRYGTPLGDRPAEYGSGPDSTRPCLPGPDPLQRGRVGAEQPLAHPRRLGL